MLKINKYDRSLAVSYALEYSLKKNPNYFDYTNYGGNCTNYVSQCVFAGASQMNFSNDGWFYISPNNTSISWANVEPFFNFAVNNQDEGFFATIGHISTCEIGDVIQLQFKDKNTYSHSLIITKIENRSPDGIFVCANSSDEKNKKLSSYTYKNARIIHILGFRTRI